VSTTLDEAWFARDAPVVAPELLGKVLVVGPCAGRISEVEAYTSAEPASHTHRGETARNRVMFGPAGRLYVYLSYGLHHCVNVVTSVPGDGQAVLLRAVEPLEGVELMLERRGGRHPLADGPGKLCQAMAVDLSMNGLALGGDVRIVDDGAPPPGPAEVIAGPRVGITKAVDLPWRWRLAPVGPRLRPRRA